jgi:hypothetical protein
MVRPKVVEVPIGSLLIVKARRLPEWRSIACHAAAEATA